MYGTNLIDNLLNREFDPNFNLEFRKRFQFSKNNIDHLNLEAELKGHDGCVNCLDWNETGTLLASGSDDLKINIWNPSQHRLIKSVETRHRGNIFSVKFLPGTHDGLIASAAADRDIYIYDLNKNCFLNEIHAHQNRVKRLTTAQDIPFLFWSCAEDGLILQHDIRCDPKEISQLLLDYSKRSTLEAKCLAINQVDPNLIAIGSTDPYARVYDRRMLKLSAFSSNGAAGSSEQASDKYVTEYALNNSCDLPITYYTPGHLPKRIEEYRKRMKTLSITSLLFSPDGKELLVNLGGEQLYLFDVARCGDKSKPLFKYNTYQDMLINVDVDKSEATETKTKKKKYVLPPKAEELKAKANSCFEQAKYLEAIEYYNLAILETSDSPILYGNRAAALMKRNWDGDFYMALLDCYKALNIDKMHLKSHFRLVKCLFELKWIEEAKECLDIFVERYPEYANSNACDILVNDVEEALFKMNEKKKKNRVTSSESSDSENEYDQFLTKKQKSSSSDNDASRSSEDDGDSRLRLMYRKYLNAKESAIDFKTRFCGHCNVSTDIKEACFLGENYISAGSDDGSFFIWDRITTNIVRVMHGDESIVNCIQPHPSVNMIATSGIDPHVRIWTPHFYENVEEEESETKAHVVTDYKEAAINNQRQMNSHPFEFLLLNVAQSQNNESDNNQNVACRPS